MATDGNQVSVFVLELVQDYYEQRKQEVLGVYTSRDKATAAIEARAAIHASWVLSVKQSSSHTKPIVFERDYDRKWSDGYNGSEQTDHYYACFIVYEMELT